MSNKTLKGIARRNEDKPIKIILRNGQSPGDLTAMAYSIKALHEQYPGKYITDVRSPCQEIFEGNPYIEPLRENDPDVRVITMEYPTIHVSNQNSVHFVNSFIDFLGDTLKIKLKTTEWQGAIYIRDEEKCWFSAIEEKLGKAVPYWICGVGWKRDYNCKQWPIEYWEQVFDSLPDVTFVKVGVGNDRWHVQPEIKRPNLIDMVGRTDLRQLIRLTYNSFGVLSYVSLPMMLGYAIPPHPRFNRKSRALITIAGGREPSHWQMASNHQYLHTCGQLSCCDMGGCWTSRCYPEGDGDEKDTRNLCMFPTTMPSGQIVPKCMTMISPELVSMHVKNYMDNLDYKV